MPVKKNNADPRAIRTRNLLQEAFALLLQEKDFESITVRDFAERATVNRATFYAHFVDRFEILEARLMESFMTAINRIISGYEVLNEETVQNIFLGVCESHEGLDTICKKKNYIACTCIRNSIHTATILLSWGMYGAAYEWNKEGRQLSAESFVRQTMPLVMNGTKELWPIIE